MLTLEELEHLFALLSGRKVFDGHLWHVFDAQGVEISNPSWMLFRGVLGALLMGAVLAPGDESAAPGLAGYPIRILRPRGRTRRPRSQNQIIVIATPPLF